MNDYIIPSMLLSWLLGLLFGFGYGLYNDWTALMFYIDCMIVVTIIFILAEFKKSHKSRAKKLKYYERIETMKVPTEFKIKRKDGTILILKAKKIIRKTSKSGKESSQ